MDGSRATRIWTAIARRARHDTGRITLASVCLSCVDTLDVTGVSVALINGVNVLEPVFASDQRAERLEELQTTVGEGPGMDALRSGLPVVVANLSTVGASTRWPAFSSEVDRIGVSAVFGFPLRIGAVTVGVLNLYRSSPGTLATGEFADAQIYADAALTLSLSKLSGVGTADEDVMDGEHRLELWHAEVHQAAGMVSVQLGIAVFEALMRLRAYAFSHERRLTEVARAVVTRRLRFGPDEDNQTVNNREGTS